MNEEIILEARNLKKYYQVKPGLFARKQDLKALDGVSFTLARNKTLAIVGESGCGKSTLARLLTLIEEPTDGTMLLHGNVVSHSDKTQIQKLRKYIQIIFQDPYGSLNPRKKISTILKEPLTINTTLNQKEKDQAARELLHKVGLKDEHYDRYPHMFSGGQRQRIAIARALIMKPDLVVADEPVSALDLSIQAQILNMLRDLQDEYNTAYVFISHGLTVVEHIADEVIVMYLGKPVEQGPADMIFNSPLHPYTRALLASTPFVDKKKRQQKVILKGELPSPLKPPAGCAFHQRCPRATDKCSKEQPLIETIQDRQIACWNVEV